MPYIPRVGDRIRAKRKVRSKIYHNLIVGPVSDVFENACRVITNEGSEMESSWQVNYSDWEILFLFDKDGKW